MLYISVSVSSAVFIDVHCTVLLIAFLYYLLLSKRIKLLRTHVIALFVAVGGCVNHPSESKVGDFYDKFVTDKHVASRQVAMNYLHTRSTGQYAHLTEVVHKPQKDF